LLETSIGEPCPRSDFTLTDSLGFHLDDDMTLDDVGEYSFYALTRIAKVPRTTSGKIPSVDIIVDREGHEERITVQVTTLGEIESQMRSTIDFGNDRLAFYIREKSTKSISDVPSELSQINFDAFHLLVRVIKSDIITTDYLIWNITGPLPRLGCFIGASDATIADIVPQVYEKWKLQLSTIEFGLTDVNTEITTVCPLTTKLSEIDLNPYSLMVGLKGQFTRPEATAPMGTAKGVITLTFQEMGKEEKFSLPFRDTASARDATEEVARYLGKPSESVVLIRDGMQLCLNWRLSNIPLGNTVITVYVSSP
jgi:hypothetical protein